MKDEWTRDEIEALADPRSFLRGSVYQRDGRVEIAQRSAAQVDAVVRGTMPYSVELRREPRTWSCTCPVGEDGIFCKHCVAVALDVAGPAPASRGSRRAAPVDEDLELRAFVASLDHEALVDLAMEQADTDWQLRERLRAHAIAAGGGTVNAREWKRRIDTVFGGRDFVPYAEAGSWAHEVCDVIDALDEVRAAGHAAAVVLLVEHANRRADEAMQHVDDSDGWLTDISERLAHLHLRACEESQPDPVALAQRIADLELTGELDTFRRAAATYAHVLGSAGIAEYRRIVEPKWRAARKSKDPYSQVAFVSTQAMIGIAQGAKIPTNSSRSERARCARPVTTSRSPRRSAPLIGKMRLSVGLAADSKRSRTDNGRRRRCVSSPPPNSAPEVTVWERRHSGGRTSNGVLRLTATASSSRRAPIPKPAGRRQSTCCASASPPWISRHEPEIRSWSARRQRPWWRSSCTRVAPPTRGTSPVRTAATTESG